MGTPQKGHETSGWSYGMEMGYPHCVNRQTPVKTQHIYAFDPSVTNYITRNFYVLKL